MQVGRIIGVTAFLGALGGLAGALGGVLIALGIAAAVKTSPDVKTLLPVFGIAATVGFGVGVIAGPVLTWTLLRRTPIWRAIGETAIAAGLAASLALTLGGSLWAAIAWSAGAATVAALRLRRVSTKAPEIESTR